MRLAPLITALVLASSPVLAHAQDEDWTTDETWEDPGDQSDEDVDDQDYWEAGGSEPKKQQSARRRSRGRRAHTRTARRGPFGLGLVFGDPTGFTGKYFLGGGHSLQGHVGWGFDYREDRATFVFDYVYHFLRAIPPLGQAGRLSPTLGIGGVLGVTNRSERAFFGVRFPFGMSFAIRPVPVEVFFEVALGMRIIPDTVHIIVDGGLGVRYYF